jgi:hypothetical protein
MTSESGKDVSFSSTAGGPPVANADPSLPLRGQNANSGTLAQHANVVPSIDALAEQQQQQRQFREHQQRSTGSVYGSGSSFKPRDAAPRLESFGNLAPERPAFRQSDLGPDRVFDAGSLDSSLPVAEGRARPLGLRARSESMREESFGSMTNVSEGSR